MDSAVIAALAGALVGGVGTVGTTYLAGLNAHNREKRQRDHSYAMSRYENAQQLLSEFISEWITVGAHADTGRQTDEEVESLATKGVQVQLMIPALEDDVSKMILSVLKKDEPDKEQPHPDSWLGSKDPRPTESVNRERFLLKAREELKKMEPKA